MTENGGEFSYPLPPYFHQLECRSIVHLIPGLNIAVLVAQNLRLIPKTGIPRKIPRTRFTVT